MSKGHLSCRHSGFCDTNLVGTSSSIIVYFIVKCKVITKDRMQRQRLNYSDIYKQMFRLQVY